MLDAGFELAEALRARMAELTFDTERGKLNLTCSFGVAEWEQGENIDQLLKRGDDTGTIEIPGRIKDTRFFDIGLPASLILGAIAAVAVPGSARTARPTITDANMGATSSTKGIIDH